MKPVFLDSGAFFALLVVEDAFHQRAADLFQQANSEGWHLITTNLVVVETYALILARTRKGRDHAVAFLNGLDTSACHIERITEQDEALGAEIVRTHRDKTYSLCDAISFAVMQRLGIAETISFDKHFREFGQFIVL
ncbi:type II toxin-antitoxin system VapC family toxin [Acaryochloris sp. CCMEE 5410]|uniref:type II toxin-antitoxin system VapC family toxin n=1 Tax=Acaryochloris sp. CCMEE 5410 TaxID=310037 RepID=UPI0002483D21|nr:PIN domain-containing protein [Acaryochloris sp. CCMEE 5410]KAI9134312.1 type II toxin-antitoxin system VapC family toxin [Acaryochloris sp. CCMEE 5410]